MRAAAARMSSSVTSIKGVQYSCASCGCLDWVRALRDAARRSLPASAAGVRARRSDAGGKRRLSIATGGTGGVFYPYGGGIAKVITDSLPNVEATAEVTAASVDNLKFLKQGTSDLAFTMSDTAQDAVLARDEFKEFGAVPLRTLAVLYSSYTHLVTLDDSGITDVRELEGPTSSPWAPPARAPPTLGYRILEAAGLDTTARHPHAEPRRRPVG